MIPKRFFLAISILVLVTVACSVGFNLPVQQINTGPTQTEDIHIAKPDTQGGPVDLSLEFGAGELNLQPGAADAVVSGKVSYNVPDLKPETTVSGTRVHIETGNLEIVGVPKFGQKYKNEWDLKLGDMPMRLTIKAGGYSGNFDLGDLSLQSLQIGDGAADVDLQFSRPNKVEMSSFNYETGASTVKLSKLANANFSTMRFQGGAGDYTFDFSGDLQRDAQVEFKAGASQLTILVPQGVSTRLVTEGELKNVTVEDAWQRSGSDYVLEGSGPTLTITVELSAGKIVLRND